MVENHNCPPSSCHRTMLRLATMLALSPLLGCGDGIERVRMSGKVTYRGQPVAVGQIRFVPAPGTEMPLTVEQIQDGRYDTSTSGGVPVGSYQVAIRAYHPDDPVPSGPGQAAQRQLLPAKFNTRSELRITLEPGEKQREEDFILTE